MLERFAHAAIAQRAIDYLRPLCHAWAAATFSRRREMLLLRHMPVHLLPQSMPAQER